MTVRYREYTPWGMVHAGWDQLERRVADIQARLGRLRRRPPVRTLELYRYPHGYMGVSIRRELR